MLEPVMRGAWWVSCAVVVGALVGACIIEKAGERSETGMCPADEKCSDKTPEGLRFSGQAFFDSERIELGPLLEGGRFQLGLNTGDGAALPAFAVTVEDERVFAAASGEGVFGPTWDDGRPIYEVQGHLELTGVTAGETRLRVVDPDTGELFDRIELDVYRLAEVEVVNVDRDRDFLYAGCEEMVGVHLYAEDVAAGTQFRAFDQNVSLSADVGVVSEEPRFWDCIAYSVPESAEEVAFQVTTGGQVYERRMTVRTLEQGDLSECPPRPVD